MNACGTIRDIEIIKLTPFASHPFKLCEGERLDNFVNSVRERGILVPIVVRPVDTDKFEILSGHNRVNAAKILNMSVVPAVVREGLTDDEAMLVVTETNLIQRSFADLSHVERAKALALRHNALKAQGKRTDLLEEIEKLSGTCAPLAKKSRQTTVGKIGWQYGVSKDTIARYLRIAKLNKELMERLDAQFHPLSIRAGVSLSYLRENEQALVEEYLLKTNDLIEIKKAEELRKKSSENELTTKDIVNILRVKTMGVANRKLYLGRELVDRFFKKTLSDKEILETITKALEQYLAEKE
jgi:ParB family chromosome partitioning protein